MSEPTQTCQLCGRQVVVRQNGRGFPPDQAKRKLKKMCTANGCSSDPRYRAGISPELQRLIAGTPGSPGDPKASTVDPARVRLP